MNIALELAEKALDRNEFPVGCILVYEGSIIAEGERRGTLRETPSELEHAEMIALGRLESLDGPLDRAKVTLYATLEPCLMCFGALLISGIGTLVYAYEDAMGGGTACDRSQMPELYRDNPIEIVAGVGRENSLELFKRYFSNPETDYWSGSHLAHYTLEQR
jgi:tRNA(adenine34) deaminase